MDIVKELYKAAHDNTMFPSHTLVGDAAYEIERLRAALLRISRYPKIPRTHEFAMSHCHEMVKLARSALQQKGE